MYDETKLKGVGACIRNLRAEQELTQFELAEKIGVSQTHLSNIECGRVQISLKLLLRIANVLDCKIDQLLDSRAALEWVNVKRAPEPPQQEYTLEEVRQLLELLRVTSK
mgnify:CR=1 FL=1